jgi:hypothetical protein
VIFLNPVTICSSCKRKSVVLPFVDEETNGSYPFANSLDGPVLDLVSQVRDVVLMNVYLDLGNSGGSGFWNRGYMSQGREMGS